VQGRVQSRSWEQDGQKRNKVEVLANDVTFLDGRNDDSNSSSSDESSSSPSPSNKKAKKDDVVVEDIGDEPINLDDIPF
jgi:single-stranded DNA-binding protein